MTSRLTIKVTRRARTQIETAISWWSAHRSSAPDAIIEDVDRALQLLIVQPNIGARAGNAKLPDVRRITLTRINYYLYYRVRGSSLEVLAFLHTRRASPL